MKSDNKRQRIPVFVTVLSYIIILLTYFAAVTAFAEDSGANQRFGFFMGWRSTWVVGISYHQSVGVPWESEWISELIVPVFAEGIIRNGSLMTGVAIPIPDSKKTGIRVKAKAMTGVLWSTDDLGSRWSLGVDGLLSTGWYEDLWSLAAEISYRSAILTLFRHSEVQRGCFGDRFPGDDIQGPAYSLIPFSSQKAGFGLAGSLLIGKGASFSLRGGIEQAASRISGQGAPPIFPLPFYLQAGGSLSW